MAIASDSPLSPFARENRNLLIGADVTAYPMAGDCGRGRLLSLDVDQGQLVLLSRDGNKTAVSFLDLRYLFFNKSITPAEHQPGKAEQSGLAAEERQPFHIVFRDNKSLSGYYKNLIKDEYGLHLFLETKSGLKRLFIPEQAVKPEQSSPFTDTDFKEKSRLNILSPKPHKPSPSRNSSSDEVLTDPPEAEVAFSSLPTHDLAELKASHVKSSALFGAARNQQPVTEEVPAFRPRPEGTRLGEILERRGLVTDEDLHMALAEKLGLPFVHLEDFNIDPNAIACLPGELAERFKAIPLSVSARHLMVAMEDPTDNEATRMLFFVTGKFIDVVVASRKEIMEAIQKWYVNRAEEDDKIVRELNLMEEEGESDWDAEKKRYEKLSAQKPLVKFINQIILDAVRRRASDIHIRPGGYDVSVVFRIDGSLIQIRKFGKTLLRSIVSRIKIMGRMNIAIRHIPQDGQSRIEDGENIVDLRISVIPTVEGESIVIRLLNKQAGLKKMEELGFRERDEKVLRSLIHRNNGLLLVTGPTGSGKSTTLYSLLQEVARQNVNIITVEDPVEYRMGGIEQIQVNAPAGLTFARALRNILRHDPDVIMVGEIRDKETGQIAIEGALTGHLVLSTLHTNSAAAAITRLLEMGIDPYLINATVLGVLAQRLIRLNCPGCLVEEQVDRHVRELLGVGPDEVFYHGKGCSKCNNTGYRGRMATYELLQLTAPIRQAVYQSASSDTLQEQATQEGMLPLTQHALIVARQHLTSLSEVYRIRLE